MTAVIDFSACQNSKPLNPLSVHLRRYIVNHIEKAERDASVSSIILTGGSKLAFSAGADLTEMTSGSLSDNINVRSMMPSLRDVVERVEACRKPVVAAIAGPCLGGGLELALSCHYRVCLATKAKLALPEVLVGLLPGAGGTQRLPRLVGLQAALQMILTAKSLNAAQSLKMGLIDAIVSDGGFSQLQEAAKKWAAWGEVMPLGDRRISQLTMQESPVVAHVILQTVRLQLPAPDAGGEAVHAALEAVRSATLLPFEKGMEREGELFFPLLTSLQGRAARHAFFAVRQAQKGIENASKQDLMAAKQHILLTSKDAETAVIGAGTMGSGIALVLLQAGFVVYLVDINMQSLDKGLKYIKSTVHHMVRRKKMSKEKAAALQAKLKGTIDMQDLKRCQLVVEAVVENIKIKRNIFAMLDKITPQSALLLTNTSTLNIDEIADTVLTSPKRRDQFAGWHFFSPANIMKLVEIVVGGTTTSPKTVAILQALTKRIGKIGVVVGNCDGFAGNRMLRPYGQESGLVLLESGASGAVSVESIDGALTKFGMAMGIFQMGDLAGNDVEYNIKLARGWARKSTSDPIPEARPKRYSELGDDLVRVLGRLGQKVGKGWYDYDPNIGKGRQPLPSREVADFVKRYCARQNTTSGYSPGHVTDEEVIQRVFFPLVNEGFKCLEEGIARQPSDIDVIYIYGYGWPAWRGGPMFWADEEIGLPILLNKLVEFSRRFPDSQHYRPSYLLKRCVELGVTVTEYYRRNLHKQQEVIAGAGRNRRSRL